MLGEDYDFEQTNHSVRPEQNSDLATQTDRDKLEKDQKDNPTLTDLWQQANGTENCEYTVISGILHKQTRDQNKQPYMQIVLSINRRQEVIRLAHSTPMAGHMGYKHTKYKIMKNFFWPGMGKEIQNACQSCERCQKTAKKSSYVAPMQKTPTITEPFHKVALDVVGPLPLTRRKNQYILTYMDLASRYPDAEPLRTTTSKEVAEALLRIFSHLSIPLEILTDRGTNFVSGFMKEVYNFLGIRHVKTSPYRPQSNGNLERFHNTLMQMVRKSLTNKRDWDVYLPYFLFACREAPSSVTGYSPFELLYGRHAHRPLDILRQQWLPTKKTSRNTSEWILDLREILSEMRDTAIANQEEAKDYYKQRHDAKARDRYYPNGTKVLVFSPVVTGKCVEKLSDRWHGPYTILGKITPVTYLVDMPDRTKHQRTVHVEAIKPWVGPTLPIQNSRQSHLRYPRLPK